MVTFFDTPDDAEDDDGELDAELAEATMVWCPYCGESVEMILDASGGGRQEYVEDCEVCCRPWSVRVTIGGDGIPDVDLQPLDG